MKTALIIMAQITFALFGCAGEEKKADLLIKGGWIITVNPQMETIEDGAIAILDGEIAAVGTTADILSEYRAEEIIDASHSLVIPGLVNTHTHAAMTLFRGFADDAPLKVWLEKFIWPAEAKFINASSVRAGAELAIAEMIRSGCTTFNDMYFFMDEVGQAVEKAGVRAVIGESVIDFPTPNAKTPEKGLEITRQLIKKWKGHPLVYPAVAAHAPYTCSPDLLKSASALALKHNLPFHIHVSETDTEVADIKNRYGRTPMAHLKHLGVLNKGTVAAHCVKLSDEDMKMMVEAGIGMSHNPESNMKLASGAAPLAELMAMNALLSLGTDGVASNNDLDMFEAMDAAAKLQIYARKDPSVLKARDLVRMATLGGAEVLGLDKLIGSIEVGKRADVAIIPLNKPHLTPIYNPYSHLVYSVSGGDVGSVIVDGRILMRDRKLLTMDEEAILKNAEKVAKRIRAAFYGE